LIIIWNINNDNQINSLNEDINKTNKFI
jgi:hypothetical protein